MTLVTTLPGQRPAASASAIVRSATWRCSSLGIEDLGAVVGADKLFAKVGPVDLEEELEDVPVGGPRGIEDDLDRLGVTRMVVVGRIVVLPAGVADAGGDDSVAVAQQFLRGPETAPGEDRGLGVLAHRSPSFEVVFKIITEGLLARPKGPDLYAADYSRRKPAPAEDTEPALRHEGERDAFRQLE